MKKELIKILLVEDNQADAQLVRECLKKEDHAEFDFVHVERLKDACKYAGKQDFDVVLLDLSLPDSNGIETVDRAIKAAPYIPIIALTGLNDDGLSIQALQAGAQDYLVKGKIDCATLTRAIRYSIERKRFEESLRESEDRYKSLFENLSDVYYRTDIKGIIQEISPSVQHFGYTVEELLGKDVTIVYHNPAYREILVQILLRDGLVKDFELVLKRKNGEPIDVSVSSRLTYDSKGKPDGVEGILRDISERKRAEQELKLRANLLDAANDSIIIHDFEGNLIYLNEAACKHRGYSRDELLKMNLRDMMTDEYRKLMEPRLKELLEKGKIRIESAHYRKDKTIIHNDVNARTIEIDGKKVVMSIGRDITESKRANKTLRESEENYRNLVEHDLTGHFISTPSGKILFCNNAFAKILGYETIEQVLNQEAKQLYPTTNNRETFLQLLCERKKLELHETTLKRKDGKHITVRENVIGDFDKDGNLLRFVGYMTDITQQKEADQLQASIYRIAKAAEDATNLNDLFKAVHNTITDVMSAKNFYIALYDEKDRVISFPYFVDEVDTAPLTRPPQRGLTEYVLRTGKALLCNGQRFDELLLQGEVENIGTPSPIWLGVPLIVENKTIGVMVVQHYSDPKVYNGREQQILEFVSSEVARVINQMKAEEQLWLQASALESTANTIVITDLKGNINWANPAFTKLTGYSFEEAIGKNPSILKSGKQDEKFYKNMWDTILAGKVWHGEIQNRRKDGTIYHEEMTITPVRSTSGEVSNYIAIKQDITEKKMVESQLLRSQRMESIGILAGGIAHDLNNVLAPILMSIEILDKSSNEHQKRMLGILKTSAQRGAEIVKQVLTFSRGADGERVLIQPKHLVHEIEIFTRQTFPKEIEIHTDVQKNLWTILGDSTQIHQVLLNLTVNARDAMPNGGIITIAVSNFVLDDNYRAMHPAAINGPYLLISISDTGTGIPENIIDKIFDPFFTTKEIGKGTGLGLSMVAGIVKSHNGFINVYSEIEKGTEFKAYLPAVETQETKEEIARYIALPAGNDELILVVDDEVSIREITKATLEAHGYRVITADDGVEAISLFVENKKDVRIVITDMAMPNMSGAILIRALVKIDPALNIIATSGIVAKKLEAKELEPSIKAFLKKPYTAETLLTTMQEVLNKS